MYAVTRTAQRNSKAEKLARCQNRKTYEVNQSSNLWKNSQFLLLSKKSSDLCHHERECLLKSTDRWSTAATAFHNKNQLEVLHLWLVSLTVHWVLATLHWHKPLFVSWGRWKLFLSNVFGGFYSILHFCIYFKLMCYRALKAFARCQRFPRCNKVKNFYPMGSKREWQNHINLICNFLKG